MTTNQMYALTNLSAGQFVSLRVSAGREPIAAARAYLQRSDLSPEIQQGFFLSVYPIGEGSDGVQDLAGPRESQEAGEVDDAGAPDVLGRRSEMPAGEVQQARRDDVVEPAGSLAAAAAAGPLHWTDDSGDSAVATDQPIIIGVPIGGAGGH